MENTTSKDRGKLWAILSYLFILWIIGIVNAATNNKKPLPVIGSVQKSGLRIFNLQTVLLDRMWKLLTKLKRDSFDFYKLMRSPSYCAWSKIKTLKIY